jgi:phosphoketolase
MKTSQSGKQKAAMGRTGRENMTNIDQHGQDRPGIRNWKWKVAG